MNRSEGGPGGRDGHRAISRRNAAFSRSSRSTHAPNSITRAASSS